MSESNEGMGCPIGQILRHKILNRHDIQIFVKEMTVLNRNNMQKYHLLNIMYKSYSKQSSNRHLHVLIKSQKQRACNKIFKK